MAFKIEKVVGKPHLKVYELVNVMKKNEATIRMKMATFESRATLLPRKRKIRGKEKRMQSLVSD